MLETALVLSLSVKPAKISLNRNGTNRYSTTMNISECLFPHLSNITVLKLFNLCYSDNIKNDSSFYEFVLPAICVSQGLLSRLFISNLWELRKITL